MSRLRFQQVFAAMMMLAALCAFVIPARYTAAAKPLFHVLVYPVARPIHLLASGVHGRVRGADRIDTEAPAGGTRSVQEILAENRELKITVANLSMQLEALKELNADRQKLGQLRELCQPAAVLGADTGGRQVLLVRGSGLRAGLAVISAGGVLGRVEAAAAGGAQVRLITDRGFRLTGSFGRFRKNSHGGTEFVRIALPAQLGTGQGDGSLAVRDVPMKDVQAADLAEGDWLVLNDSDWPMNLQGYRIGRISGPITPRTDHPLFAQIPIKPVENALMLREVMVMVK